MSAHEQWDIASGVGITALMVAAARAVESSRSDRLIDDSFAVDFVNAARLSVPLPTRWPDDGAPISSEEATFLDSTGYVGVRSRFFDEYLLSACAEGIGQVAILAAGLDSRALRLDWPANVRVFEIDQPKILQFKDAVISARGARPRCSRTVVPVDLRADWPVALRACGFAPHAPTVWLAEGLLAYLAADAEQRLFGSVDELSAAGSHLAVERTMQVAQLVRGAAVNQIGKLVDKKLDALVRTDPRPDTARWLTDRGWSVAEEPASAVAARYRRNLADSRVANPLQLQDHSVFLCACHTGATPARRRPA